MSYIGILITKFHHQSTPLKENLQCQYFQFEICYYDLPKPSSLCCSMKSVPHRPEGMTSIDFTLPDSITTWVVQAVGVSTQHGFCVGEPHNITAFKNFFVHLDLPYSAVRLEQLEVQATVYNYLNRDIMVRNVISFYIAQKRL